MADEQPEVVRNDVGERTLRTGARWSHIVLFWVMGFLGVVMVAQGALHDQIFGGLIFVVTAVLSVVKLREAVVLQPDGIVVRDRFRSRRIASDQVVAVEVEDWRSTLYVPFSFPVLRLSDGSTVPLDMLKSLGSVSREAELLRSHLQR
ncbi:PH domain-containing protein [Allokutzneria albata]|uniref:PH domain-containing protein n=1 Tax=Allokutzneria albata TaxID=211114 RepID=A0A1G9Y355_ALLAB|nr:PH domain-containing protein [Allokutzneria albata]SDN03544.1 PH domain-containing protein [Allokutzneria albata]